MSNLTNLPATELSMSNLTNLPCASLFVELTDTQLETVVGGKAVLQKVIGGDTLLADQQTKSVTLVAPSIGVIDSNVVWNYERSGITYYDTGVSVSQSKISNNINITPSIKRITLN